MREQKKRGGKKNKTFFNQEDYKSTTNSFLGAPNLGNYPSPKIPINLPGFSQYRAVIKSMHTEQESLDDGVNTHAWDLVWTQRCYDLQDHVKNREHATRKANFDRKYNFELAPYGIVKQYGAIETCFCGIV